MTVLPSPEAMIVICTVILIAYTAHVVDKAFVSSEQFESMLKARERIMGLQAENARLRELVRRYGEYTSQDRCEGCVCKSRCNDGEIEECWQLTEIRKLAHELGIEVAT